MVIILSSEKDPDVKKMIEDAIEKRLAARDEADKNKSDVSQLSDKIDKALAKRSSKSDDSDEHVHDPNATEKEHVHATHSYDKNCPTCGDKNPDYKEDQATCIDCGQPVGTPVEIEKGEVTTCPTCGGHEAEHKSRGYSI